MTASLMEAFALGAAVELADRRGLLRELARGPRSAAELGERLALDARGLARVLDVLPTHGLLQRSGERWALPAAVATCSAPTPRRAS
ncbi:MAG: hypothetical protein OXT09_35105 [Myxococcales bacterium]|nr:hypothetical protein [Myxococcales bacterium]